MQSQKLSKHNNWQHVFPDLEKYKDGVEIVYTIEEETLEGYRSKIKGDMNTGFTVTNIEKPKKPNKSPETKPKSKKTAMEAFIHNLNTMHSRAGAQIPFSSINYGTDTSVEGRLIMENPGASCQDNVLRTLRRNAFLRKNA